MNEIQKRKPRRIRDIQAKIKQLKESAYDDLFVKGKIAALLWVLGYSEGEATEMVTKAHGEEALRKFIHSLK